MTIADQSCRSIRCRYYLLPPKTFDINQIIKASTITTKITPDQTPALKMPSTNSQLDRVVVIMAKTAIMLYFLMISVLMWSKNTILTE